MLIYVISGLATLLAVTVFVVLWRRSASWSPTRDSRPEGYLHQGPYPPPGGGAG
jgi:hypothetical protein